MLSLEDIQNQSKMATATVEIEAFGGEVKIQQLTVAQSAEIFNLQQKGDAAMSLLRTASYALVEPKLTVKKLLALPDSAFDGIREIVDAVGELQEPKN